GATGRSRRRRAGAHHSESRGKPMRSKRKPPRAGPPSKPTPHATLYRPYATPKDPSPAPDTPSPMYASDGAITSASADVWTIKIGIADAKPTMRLMSGKTQAETT